MGESVLDQIEAQAEMIANALEWLDTDREHPYWEDFTKAQLIQLIEGAREALAAREGE